MAYCIVYLKATSSVSEDSLKDVIEKGDGSTNFTITGVSVKQVADPRPTTSSTEKPESAGSEKCITVVIVIGSGSGVVIVILAISLGLWWLGSKMNQGKVVADISISTFSAENEGFNGASSTAAHLITEENGTKRNSNHLQDEDTL
ncbi:hypothetical protein OS493_021082 [Desmophyllum pertusum]|uniref:Uncharacterized protein n=1 Tax=Desmophyllum pertusum TaxID=174260 RepID=A0A9X0D931_9CNID|nr:hypothetical protein OS493_021082 [Desmophyllum pertusum]